MVHRLRKQHLALISVQVEQKVYTEKMGHYFIASAREKKVKNGAKPARRSKETT